MVSIEQIQGEKLYEQMLDCWGLQVSLTTNVKSHTEKKAPYPRGN